VLVTGLRTLTHNSGPLRTFYPVEPIFLEHTKLPRISSLIFCFLLLGGCAPAIKPGGADASSQLQFQRLALNPTNGGQLVGFAELQAGDIILTAENGLNSMGVRMATLSPVSHAVVYLGDEQISEAVGSGIRRRSMTDLLAQEATVVAFRHPHLTPAQAAKIHAFAQLHEGKKYNFAGIMLQAPFALERRVCELPLVPSLVRDYCIRGMAAVQLGLGPNDRFFCSQFVLEAYRCAGLALTDADPRLITPGDLLHMREGDVPSVKIHQALQYVGHLKAPPQTIALAGPEN